MQEQEHAHNLGKQEWADKNETLETEIRLSREAIQSREQGLRERLQLLSDKRERLRVLEIEQTSLKMLIAEHITKK